ncbi:hypothetical protein ASPCAL04200 [Aspergillus calidoustus]|uniref:Uncharacterized protein n=1 Tax=Aspergillus calidoustus TaxID=454130 RepID=A0A0U5FTZ8_ASPCI|nr:hypothetical protein ASPCAL04200 [Aspergillus calidoustus]
MTDTIESLEQVVSTLLSNTISQQDSRKSKFLAKCDHLIPFVQPLTKILSILAPCNPEVFPLLRNSIPVIIEVC